MAIERTVNTSSGALRRSMANRRRFGLWLSATERKYMLLVVDLLLVNCSLLAAATMWNDLPLSVNAILANAKWFITLSILWWIVSVVLDVYNLMRSRHITGILVSAGLTVLVVDLVYLAIPWLTPPLARRIFGLGFVVFSVVGIMLWRFLYVRVFAYSSFSQRSLVLGNHSTASKLVGIASGFEQTADVDTLVNAGYHIVGLVQDQPDDAQEKESDLPVLGGVRRLVRLAKQHEIDEVIVALDQGKELSQEAFDALIDCRELGLQISSLATVYERLTGRLPVEYAQRDMNLILASVDSPASRLYGAFRRLLDIVLSVFGLVVLAQVTPAIAVLNAFWSPGPLFYRQERVGKGGRPYAVLKFRSMVPDAEKCTGAVWCGNQDSRITPVGWFLRKTRLDELPQFINVLRGEMSIVGPRPERPQFVGELARELPLYRARHAVKPGITGWAQVRYRYGNSVEDARIKLEYDLYYVKHASVYLDLQILLQTVRVVLGFMGH